MPNTNKPRLMTDDELEVQRQTIEAVKYWCLHTAKQFMKTSLEFKAVGEEDKSFIHNDRAAGALACLNTISQLYGGGRVKVLDLIKEIEEGR
jgi:hypothetical protein